MQKFLDKKVHTQSEFQVCMFIVNYVLSSFNTNSIDHTWHEWVNGEVFTIFATLIEYLNFLKTHQQVRMCEFKDLSRRVRMCELTYEMWIWHTRLRIWYVWWCHFLFSSTKKCYKHLFFPNMHMFLICIYWRMKKFNYSCWVWGLCMETCKGSEGSCNHSFADVFLSNCYLLT